jgi:hypothetical protein
MDPKKTKMGKFYKIKACLVRLKKGGQKDYGVGLSPRFSLKKGLWCGTTGKLIMKRQMHQGLDESYMAWLGHVGYPNNFD